MVVLIELLLIVSILGVMAFLGVALYTRAIAPRKTIRCPHCHEPISVEKSVRGEPAPGSGV